VFAGERAMTALGAGLDVLLLIGIVLLIARLVVDWMLVLGNGRQGNGGSAGQVIRTLTEPVLARVRRILPPVRVGTVAIDFALPVLLILLQLLRPLVRGL
jgi:YggT family protein